MRRVYPTAEILRRGKELTVVIIIVYSRQMLNSYYVFKLSMLSRIIVID